MTTPNASQHLQTGGAAEFDITFFADLTYQEKQVRQQCEKLVDLDGTPLFHLDFNPYD